MTPKGAIHPKMGDAIQASPADVTKHITSLWECTYKELALEAGRDPGNGNVAIVKVVADMKLAQTTRRAMWAAWATFSVTGIGIVVAVWVH